MTNRKFNLNKARRDINNGRDLSEKEWDVEVPADLIHLSKNFPYNEFLVILQWKGKILTYKDLYVLVAKNGTVCYIDYKIMEQLIKDWNRIKSEFKKSGKIIKMENIIIKRKVNEVWLCLENQYPRLSLIDKIGFGVRILDQEFAFKKFK